MDKVNEQLASKLAFWPYDLFGYLLPGLLFICTMSLSIQRVRNLFFERSINDDVTSSVTFWVLVLLLSSWFTGHIIAAVSSLFEVVLMRPNSDNRLLNTGGASKKSTFARYFRLYPDGYTTGMRTLIIDAFHKLHLIKEDINDCDKFHLAWHWVSEQRPIAFKRAIHFLELYGFARNSGCAFFLSGIVGMVSQWFVIGWLWAVGLFLLGILIGGLFFISYTRLYDRMLDEVFRAFVIGALTNVSEGQSP